MRNRFNILIVFILLLSAKCFEIKSQVVLGRVHYPSNFNIPEFATGKFDTLKVMTLNDIYVYPPQPFQNPDEADKYLKLIRDVKKTLPYAKLVHATIIETYEYIMTMPTEKEREEHLKLMEKELLAEYKPIMKKLTLTQGKLLIKLVDRECNQSSYNILKAFLGPIRAGIWNIFAGFFGASLKTSWDPAGKDAVTERIVELVEMGVL